MLDRSKPPPPNTSASMVLKDVRVEYCAEEAQARCLLGAMAKSPLMALDIETAPISSEMERARNLKKKLARVEGELQAVKWAKTSADEIAALDAAKKRLEAEYRYADAAGLDPHRARIRLLQIYAGGDTALIIDLDYVGDGVLALLDGANIIVHNAAFEIGFLEHASVALGEVHCTQQAVRLLLGKSFMRLDDAVAAYLDLAMDKSQQTSDWSAPRLSKAQKDYAAIDAIVTWRLAEKTLGALDEQASAYEIQMQAVAAASRMSRRGFRLDAEAHEQLVMRLEGERREAEQRFYKECDACGFSVLANQSLAAPAQKVALLKHLLSSEELERWKRTERSNELATGKSELLHIARDYPPIDALIKLAGLDKALSSFGRTLTASISPVTGRIHANYKVASTASGRASCTGPNLQQIPRGEEFRALFAPEPGFVLIAADYTTMELRAAAHVYGDRAMCEVFERGEIDMHALTASKILGKDPSKVTKKERDAVKPINFGKIYGQGVNGLIEAAWEQLGVVLDPVVAKEWIRIFDDTYTGCGRWQHDHHKLCNARQSIVIGKDARLGIGRIFRKEWTPPDASYYTRCCNLPIQGLCADISMLALAYADADLFEKGIEGGLTAWLHDELVAEVREDQAAEAAKSIVEMMTKAFAEMLPGAPLGRNRLPLVDVHVGKSWAQAKGKTKKPAS